MIRYKVKCPCGQEFWAKRARKLNKEELSALKHSSQCAECANEWKRRAAVIRSGVFVPMADEQIELDRLVRNLKENQPWGFERQPFQDKMRKQMANDQATIAEGITTRYRGYSPTREIFKLKYRVLAGAWAFAQAGVTL